MFSTVSGVVNFYAFILRHAQDERIKVCLLKCITHSNPYRVHFFDRCYLHYL